MWWRSPLDRGRERGLRPPTLRLSTGRRLRQCQRMLFRDRPQPPEEQSSPVCLWADHRKSSFPCSDRPIAETSRLLLPSLRVCMITPSRFRLGYSDLRDAISITKRYFTSDLSSLS